MYRYLFITNGKINYYPRTMPDIFSFMQDHDVSSCLIYDKEFKKCVNYVKREERTGQLVFPNIDWTPTDITFGKKWLKMLENFNKMLLIMSEEELDLIFESPNDVNWEELSMLPNLAEDFIKIFQDKLSWRLISIYQTLSEEFIREFQDKVNWYYISGCQKLSEDFIREFKDKVDWENISSNQTLSEPFRLRFLNVKSYLKILLPNFLIK